MLMSFSDHAWERARERGIRPSTMRFILDHYDQKSHARGGCHCVRITNQWLVSLTKRGFSNSEIERARGVLLIVRLVDGIVVTVIRR